MTPLTLTLTTDDVNAILTVLGDLPTKTGAWTLLCKIRDQATAQLPAAPSADA